MQAKLQLSRSIQATEVHANERLWLTDFAATALGYLLWPKGVSWIDVFDSSGTVDSPKLAERAFREDPDRRKFEPDILRLLLERGADPSRLWTWAMGVMFRESHSCSDSRRTMFFKVSAELIKAGAEEVTLPGMPDIEENAALEHIFGQLNARWLRCLREPLSQNPPTQHELSKETSSEKSNQIPNERSSTTPNETSNTPSNETSEETSKAQTTALVSIFSWLVGR
jgi:hypothetical protein